jgi:hypothetical protein
MTFLAVLRVHAGSRANFRTDSDGDRFEDTVAGRSKILIYTHLSLLRHLCLAENRHHDLSPYRIRADAVNLMARVHSFYVRVGVESVSSLKQEAAIPLLNAAIVGNPPPYC